MSIDINKAAKKVDVAEIVHHGEQIMLPEGMTIPQAMEILQRRESYYREEVSTSRMFNVFPLDGANALAEVLKNRYGWVSAEPIPGFFGAKPPQMISVEIAPNQTRQVAWGRFSLPDIPDGFMYSY
jgi:transitional endoplasmic reticulum ATPase